jgi:hypothetical protein
VFLGREIVSGGGVVKSERFNLSSSLKPARDTRLAGEREGAGAGEFDDAESFDELEER